MQLNCPIESIVTLLLHGLPIVMALINQKLKWHVNHYCNNLKENINMKCKLKNTIVTYRHGSVLTLVIVLPARHFCKRHDIFGH